MRGVSVIIRSHNGASRLPATLAHLKAQFPTIAPWELLLIDNASTDDTVKIALLCWQDVPIPLRVVRETRLDLQYANEQGMREAQYDFLAFVDDDNWVAPDWVRTVYETFVSDPALGAIGSICEPVFEAPAPEWFITFHSSYAILTDSDLNCWKPLEHLHRAGLCIRKRAWMQLIEGGFHKLAADRVGRPWLGVGDIELTFAIRLAGWKLRVEPRLRLRHPLEARNLRWEYLRRLQRGHAASQILLDAYSTHNFSMRMGLKPRLGERWWCQIARSLLRLIRRPRALIAAVISNGEGRQEVIEVERLLGRLLGMLHLRGRYGGARRHVRFAPWRLRRPEEYMRRPRPVHA